MKFLKALFLAIVFAAPAALTFTACNTTEGFGEDLSDAGDDLSQEARQAND